MTARRRFAGAAALLVGAIAVGGGAWAVGSTGTPAQPSDDPAGPADAQSTATVERQTLTVTDERDGTLGYVGTARVVSQLAGTLTWLPEEGATLDRNDLLAEVDGSSRAVLFYGDRPAWRTLRSGVSRGRDVRQLEENLAALGHLKKREVDTTWDADTTAAVKRWQKARRLPVDGVVDLGEVVFLPSAVRVNERLVEPGAMIGPGTAVLGGTSTVRAVTVELDAADVDLLPEGTAVEIELPSGATTDGTVTDVGSVASADDSQDGPGGDGSSGAATVDVTVSVDEPADLGDLEAGPVTVRVVVDRRENVLTVPVEALLALREGGYAVEIVEGSGTRRLVGVELGLFDGGAVEVRGDGLAEGASVVVPR